MPRAMPCAYLGLEDLYCGGWEFGPAGLDRGCSFHLEAKRTTGIVGATTAGVGGYWFIHCIPAVDFGSII